MNTSNKLGKVQAIVAIASLLASFFVGFVSPVRADTSVFINEIHYDNASTDEGEAIEIAGPAGTDLTGWSIVLYNGNGGTVYDTITLSDTIPDQQDGFGTLSFPQAGIQNGAPDGMALVDSSSAVVQFLSYEGSFTAVGGPADGMTSTDIGVTEGSSTAVGDSLQLTGTGSAYEDFTWAAPAPNTFGAVNTGQTFSGAGPDYTPIYDIQYTEDSSGDSPLTGEEVTTEGIVTALFYNGYFVEDPAGGAWNGLWVYDSNTPTLGDRVRVTGTVTEYYNLTQLSSLTSYEFVSSGNPVPAPEIRYSGYVSQEQWEGVLVRVENVTVTDEDLGNGEWSVSDGSGDVVVDDKGSYTYTPTNGDTLGAIIGPLDYSYGDFKIQPRDDGDIVFGGPAITSIYDIQYTTDPSGDSPYKDQTGVATEGVVTARFYNGYFIEDPTGGAWNGLWVYDSNTPTMGDRVRLTGMVEEYYNLTQLSSLTSYEVVSSGNPVPAPEILATADVSQEQWEGVLVRVENVTVTNDDLGYGEWSVSDGTGDIVIDDKGDYIYAPTNGDTLDAIIGALDYSFDAFKIQPRDDDDIILQVPLPDMIINEVDADTPSTDVLEFVELYDGGVGNTPLDGFVVVFYNGNGDTSYNSFDLDGFTTDANGYFVLGNADVDPTPSIIFGGNGLQNGADAAAVYAGDAADFPSGTALTTDDLVDAIVYDTNDGDDDGLLTLLNAEQLQVNEDGAGDKDNHSNQRCPNGSGGARNTDTYAQYVPTPGRGNICSLCGDPATLIHDIQGSGASSPEVGNVHVVEGVVVGDFQNIAGTHLGGFFLQEEDADVDADALTSEGIFVYDGHYPAVDVSVGDVVRVVGSVAEYHGLTELNKVSGMLICEPGPVATVATVNLPVSSLDVWEQYEGMLINIPQTLYATGNYYQGRYGEVDLSVDDRLDNPTNVVAPGAPALALQDINDRSRIQLEDGSTAQNPVPAPYMGDGDTLRAGDTIPGLTGVLGCYDSYEVHPTEAVNFTRVNTRDTTPPDVGGTLRVASFNVLNYFNGDGLGGGFPTPRGAGTLDEFNRQRDKIISAIIAMDADVIGLMEIENDGYDEYSAIADLVNGLNDVAGAGTYAFIDPGVAQIGVDEIAVGFVYKPGTVTLVGAAAILDSSVDPLFNSDKNRPVLAQTFEQNGTGETFTAVVNHLKSKGSDCDDLGDPDTGDGQGNCNLTRTNAVIALVNWLASDPTGSGDSDFLIIGDLNAYAMEDPITAIKGAGYTNLLETLTDPYSYVYMGQAGYLDHALANPSLADQVSGVVAWHINADEPAALDYNDYNQTGLYNPDPYRASDHDPVIVGLDLLTEGTIIVEKQTDPDGASDGFTFTGDAAGIISDGEQIVVSGLSPGAYTSQETVPAGWELTSIVCDDDNSSGDVSARTATFQLDPGETVKCTFYNTQQPGTIIVEKLTDPSGALDLFTFSGNAAGIISDGEQIVVSGLSPGAYTSQETVPAGWNLTDITCNDDNSSGDVGTGTATFQLEAGETVKCIFTNVKEITDDKPPVSWVRRLRRFRFNPTFRVRWKGYDPGGSGIQCYDVQFKDGSGSWQDWQTCTTATSAKFHGQRGHLYRFRVRATDNAGNVEDWPSRAYAWTYVLRRKWWCR